MRRVAARLELRSRAGPPRGRADHPAPLHPTSSCASCAELAREFDVGLHSHVQESKVQVIVGLKRYGKTPTAHLQDLGLLGPDFTVAPRRLARRRRHAAARRPRRLGRAQSRQQHAARQRHRRRSRRMLDTKLNVGIGTDGASCSRQPEHVRVDARSPLWSRRHRGPTMTAGSPREEILEAATAGSATRARLRRQARQDRQGLQGRYRVRRPHPHQLDARATIRPTSSSIPRTAPRCIP